MTELNGRVALVTGASGGIGAAIAHALAAAGARVAAGFGSSAAAAESVVSDITAAGGSAQAFRADMEDRDGPAQLVRAVGAALGAVEILVANHGIGRSSRYEELDAETFDRTLAINLRAPFLLAQAVLPEMRAQGFGRILFISSGAAFTGGVVGADYASSKAGLHGLTHFLASRTAADGVTVNALAPALVETAMLPGDPQALAPRVPVGRVGRPEEVADLAMAVLRNGYLTNQVLSLDGGIYPR